MPHLRWPACFYWSNDMKNKLLYIFLLLGLCGQEVFTMIGMLLLVKRHEK